MNRWSILVHALKNIVDTLKRMAAMMCFRDRTLTAAVFEVTQKS
jgi:hypothetical protein